MVEPLWVKRDRAKFLRELARVELYERGLSPSLCDDLLCRPHKKSVSRAKWWDARRALIWDLLLLGWDTRQIALALSAGVKQVRKLKGQGRDDSGGHTEEIDCEGSEGTEENVGEALGAG